MKVQTVTSSMLLGGGIAFVMLVFLAIRIWHIEFGGVLGFAVFVLVTGLGKLGGSNGQARHVPPTCYCHRRLLRLVRASCTWSRLPYMLTSDPHLGSAGSFQPYIADDLVFGNTWAGDGG